MKKKKIPLRKCIACGENKPKKELIRIVRKNDSDIEVDLTGKVNGRGAYICADLNCLNTIKKTKKLGKALECEIPSEVYDELFKIISCNKQE
ncbi:MAG: YlxR domain-containing protein [Sporanaerobacter sp.]|uniref:RNase P modulator RnpM n=1 Tax=Sporanaerobacter sp. TaxID=2010183 RepID=UPI003A102A6E